ncbi:MAG: PilN domain-containing protein [Pseudomonadota bacterium]
MIRINLLSPAETKKKKRQISASGSYGAILILVLVLEILGLYYWGDSKSAVVADKTRAVQRLEGEIKKYIDLQQQQTDLETKISQEQQQTEIFQKLRAGRVGPGNMLLYLSYILTRPPLENRDERVIQEQLGWNTGWDTDRAWFTAIKRSSGSSVELTGKALTHKDTDEVLKRLRCSVYLQNLQLVSSVQARASKQTVTLIDFSFRADLNFDIDVGKTQAELDAHEKKKQEARKAAQTKG